MLTYSPNKDKPRLLNHLEDCNIKVQELHIVIANNSQGVDLKRGAPLPTFLRLGNVSQASAQDVQRVLRYIPGSSCPRVLRVPLLGLELYARKVHRRHNRVNTVEAPSMVSG